MRPNNVVPLSPLSHGNRTYKPTDADRKKIAQRKRALDRMARDEEKRIEAECHQVG